MCDEDDIADAETIAALESEREELRKAICAIGLDLDEMRQERDRLLKERDDLSAVLDAWQRVFGTSQLSHASARLEAAEEQRDRLKAELAHWAEMREVREKQDSALFMRCGELEMENARLTRQLGLAMKGLEQLKRYGDSHAIHALAQIAEIGKEGEDETPAAKDV